MERLRGLQRRRALAGAGIAAAAAAVAVVLLVGPVHDALFGSTHENRAAGPVSPGNVKPVGRTILLLPKRRHVPKGTTGNTGTGSASGASAEFVPGQLLVKFKDGTSTRTAARLLNRVDGQGEGTVENLGVQVVTVPKADTVDSLQTLDASPAVAYVERDTAVTAFGVTPNDPLWPNQWGSVVLKLPAAWGATTGSSRVVIAVLDTGVATADPDLQRAVVPGYDVLDGSDDTADANGHGTAAAGEIAARANNATGVAGVCWSCSIMPVKVLDDDTQGTTSALAAGIVWAADHGARVISMSLGTTTPTQTLADAVNYAVSKNIVLVAAAGNNGSADPAYPAAYPDVISVAGTTPDRSLYSWSSYGTWVNLAAPGCNAAPWLNGTYVNFCGTSSATPLVAGIAGLILSARPTAGRADVMSALERTATRLPDGVQFGLVNAQGALASLGIRPRVQTVTAR